jgi:K+-sensing histidine kinase KdpD
VPSVPAPPSWPWRQGALTLDRLAELAGLAAPLALAAVLAAGSTAVWFDFFLTQPYERFTITRRTDIETIVLLLVIGVAVTKIAV